MSKVQIERSVANLVWVHSVVEKVIADWPESKVTCQSAPTDNHLLWTLGHLVTGYDWFGTLLVLGPGVGPENYRTLFGYGSKPTPDASAYPKLSEVRKVFDQSWTRLLSVASSMSDAEGLMAPVSDPHGLAATRLDVLDRVAWHDGWHSGQLVSIRRTLGLPAIM